MSDALDKRASGPFTERDNERAPAALTRPGADTEGMSFDAGKTLQEWWRELPPAERLVLLMRNREHHNTAAWPELRAWLIRLENEGKSETTIYNYERYIARLLLLYPDTPFTEFTPVQLDAALGTMPKQSRKIPRSVFKSWFEWGVLMLDEMDNTPMRKVAKAPRTVIEQKPVYDDAEVALLRGLPSPDGQLCTLLLYTGIRKGGARRLQRKHIDLDHAVMVVTEKGDKTAPVHLPPEAVAAVSDLDLWERLDPEDYLWGGKREAPMPSTSFDRWWAGDKDRGRLGVVQRAGVRRLNLHQTRHTYNRLLADRGVGIEHQRVLMRHENIATTQRYNRTSFEDAQKVMREKW
jgi:integrase